MNFKFNMVSYIFCWTLNVNTVMSFDLGQELFNGRESHSNRVRKLSRLCTATYGTLVARALAATRDVSAWIWTNPVEQTDAKDFLSSTIDLLPMVSLHQLLKKQIKWYYDSLAWLSHGLKVELSWKGSNPVKRLLL